MTALEPTVLFEDNHLLVLSKPACMPTVPDRSGDTSLLDWGKAYLKASRAKPGNVFLAVVHRLDRPVSGVVCFAVTSKAARRLAEEIRERRAEKVYLAVTENDPPGERGLLEHLLVKDTKRNQVQALPAAAGHAQGKLARTSWRVLDRRDGRVLLELRPETGRPHQLRVQCAAMGCPFMGDVKYGAPSPLPDASIALHAWRLTILHPVRREPETFVAAPPRAWPWTVWPQSPFGPGDLGLS